MNFVKASRKGDHWFTNLLRPPLRKLAALQRRLTSRSPKKLYSGQWRNHNELELNLANSYHFDALMKAIFLNPLIPNKRCYINDVPPSKGFIPWHLVNPIRLTIDWQSWLVPGYSDIRSTFSKLRGIFRELKWNFQWPDRVPQRGFIRHHNDQTNLAWYKA